MRYQAHAEESNDGEALPKVTTEDAPAEQASLANTERKMLASTVARRRQSRQKLSRKRTMLMMRRLL